MPTEDKKVNERELWLACLCVLLVLMIGVGGITRLTRSGLSIVEWNVVMGTLPPLSEEAWSSQFELYQQSPEFKKVNHSFSLSDYKQIFFWEYFHRLLGRFIFLMVLVPGIFLIRRKQATGGEVLGLALLVALQGLIGWVMVKSGLIHIPRVSPYRLTLHYLSAVGILSLIFWWYLKCSESKKNISLSLSLSSWSRGTQRLMMWFLGILFFQLIYGGFTAGLKAGFVYNSFPLMEATFLPPQAFSLDPWFVNFFENVSLVQWIHRWNAFLVLGLFFWLFSQLRQAQISLELKWAGWHVALILGVQVSLGILALIHTVPVWLGVAHQVVAAMLVLVVLRFLFVMRSQSFS